MNDSARSIFRRRHVRRIDSDIIGFAMGTDYMAKYSHAFWQLLLEGAERRAWEVDKDFMVIWGDDCDEIIARSYEYYNAGRVDAVISPGFFSKYFPEPPEIPCASVMETAVPVSPTVVLNSATGIREMMMHFAKLGHKSLLWVASHQFSHGQLRADIAKKNAEEQGLEMSSVLLGLDVFNNRKHMTLDIFNVYLCKAIEEYLDKIKSATAIFCYNDILASCLMQLLLLKGVKVPEDISICGFDNVHSRGTIPRLTTIDHRIEEMGAASVDLVMELTAEYPCDMSKWRNIVKTIPSNLVIGDTTGPAPQKK